MIYLIITVFSSFKTFNNNICQSKFDHKRLFNASDNILPELGENVIKTMQ